MSTSKKAANRKIANLKDNLRAIRIPDRWLAETIRFLRVIEAGSYAMKNRRRISAQHLKRLIAKRATIQAADPTRWHPKKKLTELPPYSQADAWGKRLVLEAYYRAFAEELTPAQAERIARVVSVMVLDKTLSGKTLRRLSARVEERGGMVFAPTEAFATGRSVPHPKARKELNGQALKEAD